MTEVQSEIERAARSLRLSSERFRQLPEVEAEQVYRTALARFVTATFEPRWWWEHLREPEEGFRHSGVSGLHDILELVPDPDERIYFIAEDALAPFYPVYFTTARGAVNVIGECFGYEYYLLPLDYTWLIGENHHDVIFGSGAPIIERIRRLK